MPELVQKGRTKQGLRIGPVVIAEGGEVRDCLLCRSLCPDTNLLRGQVMSVQEYWYQSLLCCLSYRIIISVPGCPINIVQ